MGNANRTSGPIGWIDPYEVMAVLIRFQRLAAGIFQVIGDQEGFPIQLSVLVSLRVSSGFRPVVTSKDDLVWSSWSCIGNGVTRVYG